MALPVGEKGDLGWQGGASRPLSKQTQILSPVFGAHKAYTCAGNLDGFSSLKTFSFILNLKKLS